MKVVLYGASGNSGSRILHELQSRGHEVTAAVRNPEKLPAGIKSVRDDLSSVDRIAEIITGADAVVSAYMPPPDDTDQLVAVTSSPHRGRAESRQSSPHRRGRRRFARSRSRPQPSRFGTRPTAWIPIATSHAKTLDLLKKSDIPWTYFSPAGFFEPGQRTGSSA